MKRPAKAVVVLAVLLTFVLSASSASAEFPLPTMGAVSEVRGGSAHLTGTVDPLDQDSFYFFEYSTDEVNWAQGSWQGPIPAGSGETAVSGDLSGLKASTEYFVRLSAMNFSDFVTVNSPGPNPSFTTLAIDPPSVVSIDAASEVSYTSAKASGSVERPAGEDSANDVNCRFEYVTEEQFGASGFDGAPSVACAQSPVTAEGTASVSADITGLTHSTTYHLRLVAENAGGPDTEEAPATFTTLAITAPSVTLDPVSNITGEGASLTGEVDPGNSNSAFDVTSCAFEYITEAAYGARDEVQRVTIKASGGTFKLYFEGAETDPIAYNASAASVQAALEALPNIAPGDVTVSGGPGDLIGSSPYVIAFGGSLAATDVGLVETVGGGLTGPAQTSVYTFKPGLDGQNEKQRLKVQAAAGTYTLAFARSEAETPQITAPIAFNADPATVQSALEALANVGAGNVEVSPDGNDYWVLFLGELASTNVKQLTVNGGGLIGAGSAGTVVQAQGHAEGFDGGASIPCQPETVSGGPTEVSADLTGLEPNTDYRVRLRAENLGGTTHSGEQSFATITQGPSAITFLVANLMPTSARLTGYTNPRNKPTTYHFEWGTAPDLTGAQGLPASPVSVGSSNTQQIAAQDLTGLKPDTTYYYRLVAESPLGTTEGEIESFTTPKALPPIGNGVGAFGDRRIELVSDPDKNSAPVISAAISPDGSRVIYLFEGGIGTSQMGVQSTFAAERTPSGWVARNAEPPRAEIDEPAMKINAASKDLSSLLFRGEPPFASAGTASLYRYDYGSGSFSRGVSETGGVHAQTALVADDLSRVVNVGPHLPGDPEGGLYDVTSTEPELIGLLPGEVAPDCGVAFFVSEGVMAEQNHISDDGSRVFFASRGNDCGGPAQLYMREGGGAGEGTTTLLSGPAIASDDYDAHLIKAMRDGSKIFFTTRSRLEPRDTNETPDIYRHTLGQGNFCVTCAVTEADVTPFDGAVVTAAVSADGSRVFFTSARALLPGAVAGKLNIYTWAAADPERLELGPPTGIWQLVGSGSVTAIASGNGDALVFRSSDGALNTLTGTDNGGQTQYYRYSPSERSLTCVSCTDFGPSISPSILQSNAIGRISASLLSTSGDTLLFDTVSPLVPEDVNGAQDVYEWRRGRVGLISDGISPSSVSGSGSNQKAGLTPDGKSIAFLSPTPLTAGPSDPAVGAYVARIGGGFPPPPEPPTPCTGDSCRGPQQAPPGDATPLTSTFAAPPTQPKRPRCANGKVRRKGRCVTKPRKQRKAAKQRNAAKGKRGGER